MLLICQSVSIITQQIIVDDTVCFSCPTESKRLRWNDCQLTFSNSQLSLSLISFIHNIKKSKEITSLTCLFDIFIVTVRQLYESCFFQHSLNIVSFLSIEDTKVASINLKNPAFILETGFYFFSVCQSFVVFILSTGIWQRHK